MELYHVLNRGVEKKNIFLDTLDYARFVHDMYEFNDTKPAENTRRRKETADFVGPSSRKRIVDIHGWCLMKNHYHLLLTEQIEKGLSLFVRKLNVGYAKYFNQRYKRNGYLFQGRTKKIRITSDAHYLHILHYVHLNPLDYLQTARDWRNRNIGSTTAALKHLDTYRWSSYLDYSGEKNFPSVLTTDFFQEKPGAIKNDTARYLKDIEIAEVRPFTLE
ncbi:MAG: transposase [Parcubacteria group bacterium Gr01-1014_8]|nr:MAG: transposase [Parcubacteria group bacterium Gr01-1014_8]